MLVTPTNLTSKGQPTMLDDEMTPQMLAAIEAYEAEQDDDLEDFDCLEDLLDKYLD